MQEFSDYKDLLLDIHDEWKKSEACLKEAEQINAVVIFPAIKELRYAGRRIIDALHLICTSGDHVKTTEYLLDAKFDANRARHDAVDAIVSHLSVELESLIKTHNYKTIMRFFPDLRNLIRILATVQQEIVQSRGSVENRNEVYDRIETEYYMPMLSFYKSLKFHELDLKKELSTDRKTERYAYALAVAGLVVGLSGVLFALAH